MIVHNCVGNKSFGMDFVLLCVGGVVVETVLPKAQAGLAHFPEDYPQ